MSRDGKRVTFGRNINEDSSSSSSSPEQEGYAPLGLASTSASLLAHGEGSSSGPVPTYRQEYRVYKRRWVMLLALCALNVSNGMMWLTFAPIPEYTKAFYSVSVNDVDWFSTSFFLVSLVIGLLSIVVLDTAGLRVSVWLGAGFNIVGAVLRYVSTVEGVVCSSAFPRAGFMVAIVGQILTAFAQPFLLYSPTKLANLWFGPKERAVCTNFASVANPIGIAVTQLVAPYVVTEPSRLPLLLWVYCIPAGCAAILTFCTFTRGSPRIPPAPGGDHKAVPFLRGIVKTLTNLNFLVLLITWGVGSGLFNALLTLLPQIVCPFGYSDEQAGLWGALMIFSGLVGATIAGFILDYTKKFKEVAVMSLALAILCFLWFYEVFSIQHQSINIAVSLCLFGFFALPLIPASMELGVETTYPVDEATSSGLLWSSAQICGIIMVTLGQVMQTTDPSLMDVSQCGIAQGNSSFMDHCAIHTNSSDIPASDITSPTPPSILSNSNLLFLCMEVTVFIFFVVAFRPRYRRVEDDKKRDFEASTYVYDPDRKK